MESRIFVRRTDAEAEAPILWPPDAKSWLIGKDPDPGKDWGWGEKGMTEDEMVGWHHRLNGHKSEQTLGGQGSEGQGSLGCCSPWGCKELDMTEQQQMESRKIVLMNLFAEKRWRCRHLSLCPYLCHVRMQRDDMQGMWPDKHEPSFLSAVCMCASQEFPQQLTET